MPHRDTPTSAASELAAIVSTLMKSSLQPSSLPTYKRAWKLYNQFLYSTFSGVSMALPISPPNLALFIAYLFDNHYAPSTVTTYVSALGYSHKLSGFPDPSRVFFIMQMLKGYSKLGARLDSRLPITLPILHKIIQAASRFSCSKYQICQFQAMCSIAFYAFLRVGEMTSTTRQGPQPLQIHQVVKLVNDSNDIVSLKLTFYDFKHCYNKPPFSIFINRACAFCPVQLLLEYLSMRGHKPGPLFVTSQGCPVSRTTFTDQLSLALKFCGLNPARYKGHSFRIGAASYAADRGLSDTQIRVLGRWRSNAFHRYIRIPSVST